MTQNLRNAIRTARRHPWFFLIAGTTLALGVGGTTAVVSLARSVLFMNLPYREPDSVVAVTSIPKAQKISFLFDSDYVAARTAEGVDHLAAFVPREATLTGFRYAERVRTARVTPQFLPVLGIKLARGRDFSPAEYVDRPSVAIVSYGFYRRHFNTSEPALWTITLDGIMHQVVGVLPRDFVFPARQQADILVPWPEPTVASLGGRTAFFVEVIGRVKTGVSTSLVSNSVASALTAIRATYPSQFRLMLAEARTEVAPIRDTLAASSRSLLVMLATGVILLLISTCVNISSIFLSRVTSRGAERAIRRALGADSKTLASEMLAEALLLAVIASAVGLFIATALIKGVAALAPRSISNIDSASIDMPIILLHIALALLAGIGCSIVPIVTTWQYRDMTLTPNTNKGSVEVGHSGGGRRTQAIMIGIELALTTVLAIGTGLLLRTFIYQVTIPPGFDPYRVVTARLTLPPIGYSNPERRRAFFASLVDRLRQNSGVVAAGLSSSLPFLGSSMEADATVKNHHADSPSTRVIVEAADSGYFKALKVPLLEGRYVTPADNELTAKIALVNRSLARHLGSVGIIGKQLQIANGEPMEIVGVVGDVKQRGLIDDPKPQVFLPVRQTDQSSLWITLRMGQRNEDAATALRTTLAEIDSTLPLTDIAIMTDRIAELTGVSRFLAQVLGMLSVIAAMLAAAGVYGVVGLSVGDRIHEYGIRMALGASRTQIVGQVIKYSLTIAAIALLIGLPMAAIMTRLLRGMLYGVSAYDLMTFTIVGITVIFVTVAASAAPAVRAIRADPVAILRDA